MKKFLLTISLIIISIIIPCNAYALSTAQATEAIDTTKKSSLTLNYHYADYNFDNTNVKIYYIAKPTSNFQYQLSSEFSNYPLEINSIKTEDEWNSLNQTINTYITTNNIKNTISKPIQNNKIIILDLKPGLYFIKTDKITNQNSYLLFDTNLISVPNLSEDGTWDYDVEVYLKAEEQFISNEEYNPNTGDNISIYFYLLIFSSLGLIILIVSFTLKRNKVRDRS